MKVRLHEEAYADVNEAALWYDEQESGLGDEFLAEVDAYVAGLAEQAEIWPLWPAFGRKSIRFEGVYCSASRIAIAYQVIDDTVVVLSVAANKMRPRFWVDRVER